MSENAFIGKNKQPTDAELATVLKSAKTVWDQFLDELADEYGVTIREWKCYSQKSGWSLRVALKKRTIIWLSPRTGCFGAALVFGESAMAAVRECKLPKHVAEAIEAARKYPEGTGIRLEVKKLQEIRDLKKLVEIKIAN